jgi:3-methyl-2-oxobutanoate hydroxymethyltransferase
MSHVSDAAPARVSVPQLHKWKQEGRRIVMVTAYDAATARIADPVVDVILVGDGTVNLIGSGRDEACGTGRAH